VQACGQLIVDRTDALARALCSERAEKANTTSMSRGFLVVSGTPKVALKLRFEVAASLVLLLVSLSLSSSPAAAQSAGTWNQRGAAAELQQDYDAAFEAYRQANLKKPKDLRYKTHLERIRPLAAIQHVDRGRLLRQSGDYTGAIQQFMRALEIDPSNQEAHQEIEITQREQPPPTLTGEAAKSEDEEMSHQHEMLESIGNLAGPVQLKPVSNDPITLHMVEDTKVIYQAIGKLAGLNVLFDPDYTSKRIPIDLTNVSLSDALRIVGTVSDTFFKPVTENTIFVAQDTRTKRNDIQDLAVQTFYLSNSSQPNDGNEILTGLRLLLDPSTKLYLVPSQNAIVIRATTDQLLLAQKLINDFDRAKAEVVMDVAVLEVNKDKIRNLGITLPTSIGLTPQIATTSTTGNGTTPSTNATNLSLNNLTHLNAQNFAVSVSGGTLNALLSDIDTRVLQNPRIRSTDGQRATLKIGQKIPIATGSYSAGVATGVANLGVQTQFTFVDVGVNIDITPTVHLDREISLKMRVEVSQQNGSQTISGVTEPIIGQRILEQVIQLKEGEPSILAGILTKQDNKNVNGTPGLGEIPFFKFFFSTQSKEVQDDEIVFLVIPHIVRESVITRLNTAAIDTGTSGSIALRHAEEDSAQGTTSAPGLTRNPAVRQPTSTAANAATAAIQLMQQQGRQQGRSAANAAATAINPIVGAQAVPGGPISLSVVPTNLNQQVGSTFQVAVMLANANNVFAVPMQVQYNPRVMQLVNVDAGDFLSQDGKPVALVHRDDAATGLVSISTTRPPSANGVTGQGNLCTLTFKAIAPGDGNIALVKVGAKDNQQNNLAAVGSQAVVHVQ
jgi:general secretion pathway protein D